MKICKRIKKWLYSFYEEKQDDFGFYVYIYNPKGLKFKTDSSLNTIQFATTKDSDSAYTKYTLTYLNKSEKADYEGLFYKFKVNLTEEQKMAILNGVNSSSRIYKVSGFELVTQGALNATDYAVSLTYKYSGYAKGCGPNENAESTLKFTSEGLETLSLDVHATTYRPDGTNGKNDYTQDSLHSVYFAVPNEVIEQYGEMVAVHATWLNAVLKPALVTGNLDAYNAILNYLGQDIGQHNEDLNYMYLGAHSSFSGSMGMNLTTHDCGYYYNGVSSWSGHMVGLGLGTEINSLYMLFNSGSEKDSADDYIVTSEDIQEKLIESADKFGGNLLNGKYSELVFESVDEEFTKVNIRADETYSLDSEHQVLGSSWWDKLWGITHTVSSTFDGIQAIYPIKESDTKGSIVDVSNRLFVSQSDVEDLRTYYNANKENLTVYLFRYQVSDYVSQEATLFEEGSFLGAEVWNEVDTNAYFFQETVNLDFDIIDVTFSTGIVETVIPVVSNPIDVVPDGTPPVYTESDESFDLLKLIIGLLLLILLLYFLSTTGALPLVGNVLVWVITAPFKFIKWLIDKFRGD